MNSNSWNELLHLLSSPTQVYVFLRCSSVCCSFLVDSLSGGQSETQVPSTSWLPHLKCRCLPPNSLHSTSVHRRVCTESYWTGTSSRGWIQQRCRRGVRHIHLHSVLQASVSGQPWLRGRLGNVFWICAQRKRKYGTHHVLRWWHFWRCARDNRRHDCQHWRRSRSVDFTEDHAGTVWSSEDPIGSLSLCQILFCCCLATF